MGNDVEKALYQFINARSGKGHRLNRRRIQLPIRSDHKQARFAK